MHPILISTILLYFITPIHSLYNCTFTTCACSKSVTRGYDIDCPNLHTPKVRLSFDLESHLYGINCRSNKNYTNYFPEDYLPPDIANKTLKLKYLQFQYCSLISNMSLLDVMIYLKINSTEKLTITGSNLMNIKRKDLKGLEHVKNLRVSDNIMNELPDDLIYDLKDVDEIDMHSNFLKIPQHFFKMATKLKRLELAENTLPDNTTGIFDNMQSIIKLNMWAMEIERLDEQIFKNIPMVQILDLSVNKIEHLSKHTFGKLINLENLSLRKNKLYELPEGIFENNTNLQTLKLDENLRLSVLPPQIFAKLAKLQDITLNYCNFSTFEPDIFHGLVNLKFISLSHNYLNNLPQTLFKDLTSLETMYLQNNNLEELPKNLFKHLTKLRTLDLAENKLKLFSYTFSGLNKLESLKLKQNSLKSIDSAMWNSVSSLKKLDMSYNELDDLPIGDLHNLETLKLNNNNLSSIRDDWRISAVRLAVLDLRYNNFVELSAYDFKFISDEISINLQNNNIKVINMNNAKIIFKQDLENINPFPRGFKNIKVNINNNPLHCSCNLYNLYRYYDGKMEPEVRGNVELVSDHLTCVTPESMEGIYVKDIQSERFVCDIVDACPKSADCYLQPSVKTLVVDYSYKGLTEIPLINENIAELITKQYEYLGDINIIFNISRNNLTSVTEQRDGYEKVTVLDISNNKLKRIHWLPENTEVLFLHGNNIEEINATDLSTFKNAKLKNITFYDNPWTCTCEAVKFMKYLQENFDKVNKPYDIKCKHTDLELASLTVEQLCPLAREILIASLVSVAIMSLIVTLFAIVFYRYNTEIKVWLYARQYCLWWVTEEELDKDKLYDAFISYSHADEDFVVSELLPKLERRPDPYKLCLHFRNWLPGEFITTNIARSIAESRRTIVVLSVNFLKSEWGKMEFRTAHTQALNEGRARVIIVILGDVPMNDLDEELKAYLNTNTYVKWGDPWFWDKLQYALPHQSSFFKQNISHSIIKMDDKFDLIHEPSTPPILSTPPVDKLNFEPILINNAAMNITLVNGTLINNALNTAKCV